MRVLRVPDGCRLISMQAAGMGGKPIPYLCPFPACLDDSHLLFDLTVAFDLNYYCVPMIIFNLCSNMCEVCRVRCFCLFSVLPFVH